MEQELFNAIENNRSNIVKYLLHVEVDPNIQDEYGKYTIDICITERLY